METRVLGKSDLKVSTVCFGAWPIGGGMGRVDPQEAVKTIHAAINAGIAFIDTAEGYQTSESVLGQALKSRRDSVILATKLSGPDHSASHIRNALENSLSALNTEYIDLYQLHTPQPKWPISFFSQKANVGSSCRKSRLYRGCELTIGPYPIASSVCPDVKLDRPIWRIFPSSFKSFKISIVFSIGHLGCGVCSW